MATLAKILKSRTSLKTTLATLNQRAQAGAVSGKDEMPDFSTMECLNGFLSTQFALRQAKIQSAKASVTVEILIPADVEVAEAGTKVPVYQAVLIRDDLKGYKSLLERISSVPTADFDYGDNGRVKVEKVRHFVFAEVIAKIDLIQEWIDMIDSAIQFVDNTVEV